jgi:hypothetical protein
MARMSKMYISGNFYMDMPFKSDSHPRDRFKQYYADLHAMEGINAPANDCYIKKNAYTYAELGESVLQKAAIEQDFSELDGFVVCYWGHEYDPQSTFGSYFASHFKIDCRMFDVCDQGILSLFTAVQIIWSYIKNKKAKKFALLCLDQAAIPVVEGFTGALPAAAASRLLIFSDEKGLSTKFEVLSCAIEPYSPDESAITLEPGANEYCTAKLFTPIFNQQHTVSIPFKLTVKDSETNKQGSLKLVRVK